MKRILPVLAAGCFLFPAGAQRLIGMTEPGPDLRATKISVPEAPFRLFEIKVLESLPPQFVVGLVRDMPTPGWTMHVDSVDKDPDNRRIVVRISERSPKGMVAQVIMPARVQIELGHLQSGRHVLELWVRGRGRTPDDYVLAQAIVISATDPLRPGGTAK